MSNTLTLKESRGAFETTQHINIVQSNIAMFVKDLIVLRNSLWVSNSLSPLRIVEMGNSMQRTKQFTSCVTFANS